MIFIYSSQIVIQQTTIKLEIISILNQQICHYLINLLNQASKRSGEGGGRGGGEIRECSFKNHSAQQLITCSTAAALIYFSLFSLLDFKG